VRLEEFFADNGFEPDPFAEAIFFFGFVVFEATGTRVDGVFFWSATSID
jgi:hypothetical protein